MRPRPHRLSSRQLGSCAAFIRRYLVRAAFLFGFDLCGRSINPTPYCGGAGCSGDAEKTEERDDPVSAQCSDLHRGLCVDTEDATCGTCEAGLVAFCGLSYGPSLRG